MTTSKARENILHRIRQALINPVPLPFPDIDDTAPIFSKPEGNAAEIFADEFSKLQGKFIFCNNKTDLQEQLNLLIAEKKWSDIFFNEAQMTALFANGNSYHALDSCEVAVTSCECLVARTGTIVLSAAQQCGRTTSVYAPIHICIAYTDQLVDDLPEAFIFLKEKYNKGLPSLISFASGPSRTADIEKTLVTGVHGPKEVYCFLVQR